MGINPWARRKSRRAVLQALYQWQLAGASVSDIKLQFRENGSLDKADLDFFDQSIQSVIENIEKLSDVFVPFLDRGLDDLGAIERGALLAGTYELRDLDSIPFRVVINEWVELTKDFGATESYKYVNSILDAVSKRLRNDEQ
jgi:N utilization substance protein B|tara:strand:- start:289 stop:714 length:426 start_codon:yes stop_codon:yes gene_type:complete